jgi:hypothetical protein
MIFVAKQLQNSRMSTQAENLYGSGVGNDNKNVILSHAFCTQNTYQIKFSVPRSISDTIVLLRIPSCRQQPRILHCLLQKICNWRFIRYSWYLTCHASKKWTGWVAALLCAPNISILRIIVPLFQQRLPWILGKGWLVKPVLKDTLNVQLYFYVAGVGPISTPWTSIDEEGKQWRH